MNTDFNTEQPRSWIKFFFRPESAANYAVVFRIGFALLAAAIFAVTSAWYVQRDLNAKFRAQLQSIDQKFQQMSHEHEQALAAGHAATIARDEILNLWQQCELKFEQPQQGIAKK